MNLNWDSLKFEGNCCLKLDSIQCGYINCYEDALKPTNQASMVRAGEISKCAFCLGNGYITSCEGKVVEI
jgi:hypothetical protein